MATNTKIQIVNHKELRELIVLYYSAQQKQDGVCANFPLFIWGATGIGKSQGVFEAGEELAKSRKREVKVWNRMTKEEKNELLESEELQEKTFLIAERRASDIGDPSDVKGMLDIDNKNYVDMIPTRLSLALSKEKLHGIMFLDEFNLAPPSIQAAFYQIINDRTVSDISFNKNFIFIAAGNRTEDKAYTFTMARPLLNRFAHVELSNGIETWTDWAIAKGVDERIIMFNKRWKGEKLSPEVGDDEVAFPTYRQWAKVSPIIKDVPTESIIKENGQYMKAIAALLGRAQAEGLRVFLAEEASLNVDDLLKNPDKIEALELPKMFALISILVSKYKANEIKTDQALVVADHFKKELCIDFIRLCKRTNEKKFAADVTKQGSDSFKMFEKFYKKYGQFFIQISY